MGIPTTPDSPSNFTPVDRPDNPPGFQLFDLLGEGGMGKVFLAREVRSGRSVAIKFANRANLPRFRREFRELNKLDNPHILRVLDFDPFFEPPYLVMEYLKGDPLNRYCHTFPEHRLPLSIGVPLFIQLSEALFFLHGNNILHRDLKPSNLMVLSDQAVPFIKIMDFGLVRPNQTVNILTVSGQLLGTPAYMAPEQFDNPSGLTPQSDLYSLGIIMYEAFSGKKPFEAEDTRSWYKKHKTEKPISPDRVVSDLFPELSEIIMELLNKKPEERPSSAEVVRIRLSHLTFYQEVFSSPQIQTTQSFDGVLLNRRYQIQSKLGQGGFGLVFKAWDTILNLPVAIKINQGVSTESELQFKREASLLANLHHPNLPRVTDYFTTPYGQCLVMDFIEGENLFEILLAAKNDPDKAFTEKDILFLANQMCDAIEYLHSQTPPIIHRDIKPPNIIITPKKKAVLVDFGIFKTGINLRTHTGAVGVTAGYAPPEQYSHMEDHTDVRSDIYGLGATLYTLLTGKVPTESILLANGLAPRLAPANTINPTVSKSLSWVVNSSMQIKKEDRFQSIREFRSALKSVETEASNGLFVSWVGPKWAKIIMLLTILGYGIVALLAGILFILPLLVQLSGTSLAQPSPNPGIVLPLPIIESTNTASYIHASTTPSRIQPATSTRFVHTIPLNVTNEPIISATLGTPLDRILFVSNREGREDIFWMNPDGTEQENLTKSSFSEGHPSWSPDYTKIVYHSNCDDPGFDLYIWSLLDNKITRLTDSPGWDGQPEWSPDGRKIAFESQRSGQFRVYIVNIDGSGLKLLTNTMSGGYPSWSPDNKTIVFASSQNGKSDIYTIDYEGKNLQQLTANTQDNWMPRFSPDGQWIVFSSKRNGNRGIYRVHPDGTGAQRITESDEWWPVSFSPDGRRMAFVSNKNGNWDIFVMNLGDLNTTQLTSDLNDDNWPAWGKPALLKPPVFNNAIRQ